MWVHLVISKSGLPRPPKSHHGPKKPLKGPRRAKIGTNASHTVQLTSLGPKKPDSNPTPQRSVPLTWNQPHVRIPLKLVVMTAAITAERTQNNLTQGSMICLQPPHSASQNYMGYETVGKQLKYAINCWHS